MAIHKVTSTRDYLAAELQGRKGHLLRRGFEQISSALAYASALLEDPFTPAAAERAIRRRDATRVDAFLETLDRAVFANAESPYRSLFAAAWFNRDDVKTLVRTEGLEGALHRLAERGVHISIEEFKGLREVRRGRHTFWFSEQAFRNPLIRSGLIASSGGTQSPGLVTTIAASNHRMGAEHLAAAIAAYGLQELPVIVVLPQAHGASLWAVLALAAMGKTPPCWFSQLSARTVGGSSLRLFISTLRLWSRARGHPLPSPTHVPFRSERKVLRWITDGGGAHGCGILTTPSTALRLALAAQEQGKRLDKVTFITVAEPLTLAKATQIARVGGRAYSSLGFTEFGRVSYGCTEARAIDDTHICRDAIAVIQRRRAVDLLGSEVDALLFTSIWPDARRILLNMETGDYARMVSRQCGCPLGRLGWSDHLEEIRSFEKLNAEGRLFFGTRLISLVEEILPQRFGGDPTDYQLVEQEDREGFTRFNIYVHPRLGSIDEGAIRSCVARVLRGQNVYHSLIWEETETLQVVRQEPLMTKAGKLMPLHHLSAAH